MGDFSSFQKNMQQRAKNVSLNADQVVRKCGLAVDGAVVIATPVDTGRARANWQVELGAPTQGRREAYSEGEEGSTAGVNAREAINQGKAKIAEYKGGQVNSSIHITNNLAYIGRLNTGYSAQAPAGFVEKAVMVGVNAIKRYAGKIAVTNVIRE